MTADMQFTVCIHHAFALKILWMDTYTGINKINVHTPTSSTGLCDHPVLDFPGCGYCHVSWTLADTCNLKENYGWHHVAADLWVRKSQQVK